MSSVNYPTWMLAEPHRIEGMKELHALAYVHIHKLLREALTDELRKKPWRGNKNPIAGHCYVACEVLHVFYPAYKPYFIKHEGQPHWFLRSSGEGVIDITFNQFNSMVPYVKGIRKGFLTKEPSKRAQIVLDRMMLAAMVGV